MIVVIIAIILGLLILLASSLTHTRKRVLGYMLITRRPLYGLDFIYARIAGRGLIYIILGELEQEGLLRSWWVPRVLDQGSQRRMYELTELGVAVARAMVNKKGAAL
jgi:DNA-binding PadR family transcriptional regulator